MIWHEDYHHGQIKLALKVADCPFDLNARSWFCDESEFPAWQEPWMDSSPTKALSKTQWSQW